MKGPWGRGKEVSVFKAPTMCWDFICVLPPDAHGRMASIRMFCADLENRSWTEEGSVRDTFKVA